MEEMMGKQGMTCKCGHHKTMPWLVVLFGLVFLAQAVGWMMASTVAVIWPIIVIVAGLAKVFGMRCKCC